MFIRLVSERDSPTVQELASLAGIDMGAITRVVARLEEKRLVTRHSSKSDGRITIIRLSSKGRALIPELQRAQKEFHLDLSKHIDKTEVNLLLEALKNMFQDKSLERCE